MDRREQYNHYLATPNPWIDYSSTIRKQSSMADDIVSLPLGRFSYGSLVLHLLEYQNHG